MHLSKPMTVGSTIFKSGIISSVCSNRGSLPGLAAVLLVMVVATIGFTSSLNIPDPQESLSHATGLLSALEKNKIIGGIQGGDGAILPIMSNADPDFLQSINRFVSDFGSYPVYFAVIRVTPNATFSGLGPIVYGAQDPAAGPGIFTGDCQTAAAAYHADGPFNENYVDICMVTQPNSTDITYTIIPAAVKRS